MNTDHLLPDDAGPDAVAAAFDVSRESLTRLRLYVALLLKWQKRINLIGRTTEDHVWVRHVADGLQVMAHVPPATRRIVDLGSGAGIPGLVMALAAPVGDDAPMVHLVESNAKKAAFLREAVRVTQARAQVHNARIEQLGAADFRGTADVVTARALAPLYRLVGMAQAVSGKDTICLFHKGQDVDSELTETTKCWNIKTTRYPSQTSAGGCIIKIEEVERATAS